MKQLKTLAVALALATVGCAAQAALVSRSNGLIYDTEKNLTILADVNYAKTSAYDADGALTWGQAVAYADQLNYAGYSDWRLPDISELTHIFFGELGYVVGQPYELTNLSAEQLANQRLFVNMPFRASGSYWSSTAGNVAGYYWYAYTSYGGLSGFLPNGTTLGGRPNQMSALVVRSGDVAATANDVPEPTSLALTGLALLGAAAARRRVLRG